MVVMTGDRSDEDPSRIEHTVMGPRREDVCQGGQIRGRSRQLVRSVGSDRSSMKPWSFAGGPGFSV